VAARGSPLYGADGHYLGYTGFGYDVTERKNSLAELQRARDAAEKAAQVKSEFLAHMSHEIRTPLNCVLGMTDLVLDSPLAVEQREQLEMVKTAADALLAIVNDVLDVSKIDAGKLELHMRPVPIKVVLEEVSGLMKIPFERKGVALTVSCDSTAPEHTLADYSRLRQVLFNLLDNARKFTPKDGCVSLSVRSVDANPGMVEWRVEDSGVGISADKIERIFEPFTQADSTTSKVYGGTGLGLTIAARIVQGMGGTLSVTSKPGEGSCFYFTTQGARDGVTVASAATPPEKPVELSKGARVLLVEDNQVNRALGCKLLERAGCEVVAAENGYEALRLAAEQSFDVILMDVQMPGLDGYETTRLLRARENQTNLRVPIIALTAYALPDDKQRCLESGMDDYLSKPFSRAELLQAIARVCSHE
jgi:CheY-like chemotaxis protein